MNSQNLNNFVGGCDRREFCLGFGDGLCDKLKLTSLQAEAGRS